MNLRSVFLMTFWLVVAGSISMVQAQEAVFALAPAVVDSPYSQSVPEMLRSEYRREFSTAGGSIEWRGTRELPSGLAIDSAGIIYGTPQIYGPKAFRFHVQIVDRANPNAPATSLLLSLRILKGGPSSGGPGPGPILGPVNPQGPSQGGIGRPIGVQVEVSGFEPRKSVTLPIVVKSPAPIQLEAVVFDKDGKSLRSVFTDKLPAGDVYTSVKIEMQAGRNTVAIRDAATGAHYKTLTVDVPATVIAEVASDGEKEFGIKLKHKGVVASGATTAKIKVQVSDPAIEKVTLSVKAAKDGGEVDSATMTVAKGKQEYEQTVKLGPGDNRIIAHDADNEKAGSTSVDIKREEDPIKVEGSRLIGRSTSTMPITIKVLDPAIAKIKVMVAGKEKATDKTKKIFYNYFVACASALKEGCPQRIDLPEGIDSTVYLIDVTNKKDDKAALDEVNLTYWEDRASHPEARASAEFVRKESKDDDVSTIPLSSVNTRAILGFEQAGASSSESTSKPFLDFFFTAPLWFKRHQDELPRVSLWGNIRLAVIPQQASAFGVFPTTLVNQITESKLTNLAQGFDFLVGPEFRVGTSKAVPSLIPGVKQRVSVYLAGGFGAISPLDPKQQDNVQIFTVPDPTSPQYQEFKERFPDAAASGKPYVAFTFPERDRFLRQFYGGLRFKTHFENGEGLINRFPAIFDLMLGRNEAATGGKLQHTVLRLEGFYPLPIKEASFLYIYGTAIMKLGGGGPVVRKPLFLDTPGSTIGLSSPDLFIVPNRQNNSDYYRIGVGLDLMRLFNKKPKEQQ